MSRRKSFAVSLVIGAVVVGAGAQPAFASPGFALTTNNGGSGAPVYTQGVISYKADTNYFAVVTQNWSTLVSCGSSTQSSFGGKMNRGLYSTPGLGNVATSTFGTATWNGSAVVPGSAPCQGPAGVATAVTRVGTWQLSIDTAIAPGDSTPELNQDSLLALGNVKLRVNVGTCAFDIGGLDTRSSQTPGPYRTTSAASGSQLPSTNYPVMTNTAGKSTISIGSPLTGTRERVWNTSSPSGCSSGLIKNGDQIGITGRFDVSAISPATDAIWLSA